MDKKNGMRKVMDWQIRVSRNIKAADVDKRMGIPECARKMLQHKPYQGVKNGE